MGLAVHGPHVAQPSDGIASGDFVRRETVGLHARKKVKQGGPCPFD
eukprot:COSAG01_NODE_47400_length_390_cov_2.501718_1_plen_45_part_10